MLNWYSAVVASTMLNIDAGNHKVRERERDWILGCDVVPRMQFELSPIPTHAPTTTPTPIPPMENPKLSETNLVFQDQ